MYWFNCMLITSETFARLPVLSAAFRFFLPASSAWRLLGVAAFSESLMAAGCSAFSSSFFLPPLALDYWKGKGGMQGAYMNGTGYCPWLDWPSCCDGICCICAICCIM